MWVAFALALGCAARRDPPAPAAGTFPDTFPLEVSEGTALYFDPTPDGRALVIDLLGQLWEVPVSGGPARPLSDAVAERADDRHPSVSPDGRWIATRSDRADGRGIWIHSYDGRTHRPVTDSALLLGDDVGVPVWTPGGRELVYARRGTIMLTDVATRSTRALAFDPLPNESLDEPALSPDGRRLLVTGPWAGGAARALLDGPAGAALWEVELATGRARRLAEGETARAPAYSPGGERIAYFRVETVGPRLVVRSPDGTERVVTQEAEIEPRRVRWSADGRELYYVAAGRLRRVASSGGSSRPIHFTARLDVPIPVPVRAAPPLPEPGSESPARGLTGVALAPDGSRIALLALGRLWLVDREGRARAAAAVPVTANRLSWAPDGRRITWADGVEGEQDLWVTDVETGTHERLTELPGAEGLVGWSPSGEWIAFTHDDRLRAVAAPGGGFQDSVLDLGPVGFSETAAFGSPFAWLPGDTLLLYGMDSWPVATRACVRAELAAPNGERLPVERFPCRPGHAAVAADGALLAIESGLLVRRPRIPGGWGRAEPLAGEAALYPSAAADGSVLRVAPDGLRLRPSNAPERTLGWPVRFRVPRPPPLLLRNVRMVPLDGGHGTPRDVLIEGGRIRAIAPAGSLSPPPAADGRTLDAGGRWLLPGLIDTHLHFIDTDLAVAERALAHGVTTLREMWDALGVAAAFRDAVDAGVVNGARIVVSGPPFYPSPDGVAVTTDFLWVPTDSAEADRGLALLAGFGARHAKMRYVQSWSAGGRFVTRAAAFGLRVSGHCAHGLAVVLAGVAGHEHADGQCGDWEFGLREDVVGLYRAAGVTATPIIDLHAAAVRRSRTALPEDVRGRLERRTARALAHARRLYEGGVPLVAGSDAQDDPGALHRELERLVEAGLSPRAALLAATRDAAAVLGLGAEIGTVGVGYVADLLLLDGDPLGDIRSTREIWRVIRAGRVLEREPPP